MTILFKDVRLNYCHLTTPTLDKLSGKEVYKCLMEVPATKENIENLQREIDSAIDYAVENKIKALGPKASKVPQHCPDVENILSEDRKWLRVNISVAKPILVYDRFGVVQEDCRVRRVNSADVQLFAYSWVHGLSWGIKLCPRAICIREDIAALMAKQEDGAGMDAGCEFTFDAPAVTNSVIPF